MKLRTRLEFISLESLYAVTLLSWGSGIIKNYVGKWSDNYVTSAQGIPEAKLKTINLSWILVTSFSAI
jgi:hypothetical protein